MTTGHERLLRDLTNMKARTLQKEVILGLLKTAFISTLTKGVHKCHKHGIKCEREICMDVYIGKSKMSSFKAHTNRKRITLK